MKIFGGLWSNADEMCESFKPDSWRPRGVAVDLTGIEILRAVYRQPDYEGEGEAYVLFKKDGKMYEVYASHCSCFGLEGQWAPEEVTKADLLFRKERGYLWALTMEEIEALP